MSKIYRKTYAEINLNNLYQNYKSVQKITKSKKIIPVVKANAYGHGAIKVVEYLEKYGIDHFAVSMIEEALEIRESQKNIEILIMGVTHREDFDVASEYNFSITVSNMDQVEILKYFNRKLKIHLKIDSGMNRLGFKSETDIHQAVKLLSSNNHLDLEGIYTHFATADEDEEYYLMQQKRFKNVLENLDYKFEMVHCSNSSSSIKYEKDMEFNTHSRLGISLYGLTLDEGMAFLKNTYRLITHISEIKHLVKGDKVGYGSTYEAKEDEIIGILPIGYADGFIRQNQNGDVEINGERYPIIGRICMDQMFIKIDSNITKDDKVILFGGLITIDEVAKRLNTINYEVICQITYRVPKVYI